MKPLVEIGFMPEALSVKPEPYQPSLGSRDSRTNEHLHRLGVSAEGLRGSGVNWSTSGCGTASNVWPSRGGELVLGSLERA